MGPARSVGSKFQGTWTSSGHQLLENNQRRRRKQAQDTHPTRQAKHRMQPVTTNTTSSSVPHPKSSSHCISSAGLSSSPQPTPVRNEHVTWRDAMPCPQSEEQALHSPVSLACNQRNGKTSKNNADKKTRNGARKREGELNGWTYHPGAKGDTIDRKCTTQARKKTCDLPKHVSYVAKEKKGTEGCRGRRLHGSPRRGCAFAVKRCRN